MNIVNIVIIRKKMNTSKSPNDELKKDLATLKIDADKLESLSVQQARSAYHKIALVVHPDKADLKNPEQIAEYTAAFKELGNAYQRVIKFIIERLQKPDEDESEPMNGLGNAIEWHIVGLYIQPPGIMLNVYIR